MLTDDYERVLLVKPEVFVYRIPPRTTNRAYRAADWTLDAPDWTGRMRITSLGKKCTIKLEDKVSGELFAACPIETFPSPAVESVSDSARYFVIMIKDGSGRSAFIGIGFIDRSDSFDFNVALQDFFKYLKKDEEAKINAANPQLVNEKKLDLSFKEGQTIKINIGTKSSSSMPRQKPKAMGNNMGILLPPPPGSKLKQNQAPLKAAYPHEEQTASSTNSPDNLLLDF